MTSLSRALAVLCILGAVGCDNPTPMDGGVADGAVDGAVVRLDSGTPCTSDPECDDGVECTDDTCFFGFCRIAVNAAFCQDGVFCNGVERCDTRQGCLPAPVRETCSDDNVCTIDRCDEAAQNCTYSPRDIDEDGDADWFCAAGGDCNDTNPSVNSHVNEVCGDRIDNNCDSRIDEAACGRPRYDICSDALDVSAGGFFMLSTNGAASDYSSTCVPAGQRDVVATFTIDTPRSLRVVAEGSRFNVAVALRRDCTDAASELGCEGPRLPAVLRRRSLDPGTYSLIVSSAVAGNIGLDVRFGDPIEPATNDTCASTPIDVSAGGRFAGSFVEARDDEMLTCSFENSPDLVYTFTTNVEQNVQISAQTVTGEPLAFSVRSTCADAGTSLRCAYGNPASGKLFQLPPSTYFIIVEGPNYIDVDFTLDVAYLAPTPPPLGDVCTDAIPLTLGTPYIGTLLDRQDDIEVSCGLRYRDIIHVFTLEESADVVVDFDTAAQAAISLRTDCADGATQVRCASGNPVSHVVHALAPGVYYLIAESIRAGGYSLTVTARPPTTPTDVAGNDTCSNAHVIPITGGFFRGNTSTLLPSYMTSTCGSMASSRDATFRLNLVSPRRVIVSTLGSSFDTVLHVHQNQCIDRGDLYCDDGSGFSSEINRELPAGNWYFIVDGFGTSSEGEYLLDVSVQPL